jgi:subtilase family serine protease
MRQRPGRSSLFGWVALLAGALLVSVAPTGSSMAEAASGAVHAVMSPLVVYHAGSTQPLTDPQCEADLSIACYQGPQLQAAYDLFPLYGRGITGRGETIVIVDSLGSPTIAKDLATYDAQYRLPPPPSLNIIQPAGAVPPYQANSTFEGWAAETTLDVEMAHTMAPGASILLVETPVAETEGVTGFPQIVQAENYVIDHNMGDVISQSFGATEQTFPNSASIQDLRSAYFNAANHGVTVLASTGDTGVANYTVNGVDYYTYPVVGWPASDPLVTAVGGTQLHLDDAGNRVSPDTVWNDTYNPAVDEFVDHDTGPNPIASSGGVSSVFSRPSYQDDVANVVGNSRGLPDVAMSAACNGAIQTYDSWPGIPPGWLQICGTSEASPLFSGIVALADQVAGHRLGLINPALYTMKAHGASGLVPVTSGDNTVSFTQNGQSYTIPGYHASYGYNLASGLGTIDGARFVPALAAYASGSGGFGRP